MGLKINKIVGEKKQDAFGYAIAIGDLTGDKKNQIAIASTNGLKGGSITIFSSSLKAIKKISISNKKVSTIRLLIVDLNKDDIDELVIAVTYQDLSGEVKVFSLKHNKFIYRWQSQQKHDAFGFAIATGDVNGDDYPDLIISAPQPIENGKGKVYVYSGKDGQLIRHFSSIIPREYSHFGTSIACADVNGDGLDEVIIGAPGTPVGEVYIYSAHYGWLMHKLTGDHSGYGVNVFADDLNGDEKKELIVTTKRLEGNQVSIFGGSFFEHLYTLETDEVDAGFGETITSGDINGDGTKKLIIGAFDQHYRRKKYTGRVSVFNGKDGKLHHRWYGKDEKDQFGFALTTGKLYSSKIDSILIGAPREMNSKKGIVYIVTNK